MRLTGEERTRIEETLRTIYDKYQSLTPTAVVEEARAPDSILHGQFEWDDTKAAARYRLAQARQLIQSVEIEVSSGSSGGEISFAPCYVRDPEKDRAEQGYVLTTSLIGQQALALAALEREVERLRSCFVRAEAIAAVLGLDKRFHGAAQRSMGHLEKLLADAKAQAA